MFAIPEWLLRSTSAAQFAGNPGKPGWSDVMTGIGHSMADHARGTIAGSDYGVPPAAHAASATPAVAPPGGFTSLADILHHAIASGAVDPTKHAQYAGAMGSFGQVSAPNINPNPAPAPRPMPAMPAPSFAPSFQGPNVGMISRALGGQ